MAKQGVLASSVGVKVVLFPRGKTSVLNSPGVLKALGSRAAAICAAANGSAGIKGARYENDGGRAGKRRGHAIVHTANYEAMLDQHRNKTLNRVQGRITK